MAEVHEIADGIYRIASFNPQSPVTYIQFLIKDERPLLFETGPRALFSDTLEAVKKILDPSTLRYVSWSHLESDECGAANDFLKVAPQAEPLCGEVGAFLSVGDFFSRTVRGMKDSELLDLGRHRIRFLTTPHVPHSWDAILLYDETTRTLFASDLFAHLGKLLPITEGDIVGPAMELYRFRPDYLPVGSHTEQVLRRLEALAPEVLAAHHAPAFHGNVAQALRDLRQALLPPAR